MIITKSKLYLEGQIENLKKKGVLFNIMNEESAKEMKNNFYRLLTCRELRNASAHSNCILNDLKSGMIAHKTNSSVFLLFMIPYLVHPMQ